MKYGIASAAAALFIAGCSTNPDTGTRALIGPTAAAGVVAVSGEAAAISVTPNAPTGATSLGEISGVSCRNNPADPAPTEERALNQLKQKVANAGGTGVAGVSYKKGGTSLMTNCWSTVTATGQAYR